MVCAPSTLLLASALTALLVPQYADATSIVLNPETRNESSKMILSSSDNPVRGSKPGPHMLKPFLPGPDPTLSKKTVFELASNGLIGNDTQSNNTPSHRKLEVTSADVQTLEAYFGTSMETNVNTIQQKYARGSSGTIPWPSSYWPTYLDSINYRWTDEASPAEKYAKAFGKNVKAFTDNVSKKLGVDSQADGNRVCSDDSQCSRFSDGSACAKRDGSNYGYCVPTWYGICHAWAPAAILEAEPRCNVVKNGVTFRPFDIKGLMTAVYDGANVPIVFTGARYDGAGSSRDEYGRYTDPFERDLGPGFFHIAVTNIMGRFGKSFIVDVNADAQVWNQPTRSYEIRQMEIMTPTQAAWGYFGVPKYPFNNNAKSIAFVQMSFKYINEYIQDGPLVSSGVVEKATVTKDYYYLLELDSNKKIIGGEWLYGSQTDHPDFLWFNTDKPSIDTVTNLDLSYRTVLELLQQSVSCSTAPPTPTTTAPPPTPTTTAPPPTPTTTAPPPTPTTTAPPPTPSTTAPSPIPSTTAPPPASGGACGNDQTGPLACPSGEYCQPWNPAFYQCRTLDAKCGKQEVAVDYYGDDIATHQLLLPEQCCDKCYETPGCKAYTFVNYNSDGKAYCYLKSGTGSRSNKVGVVSAVISPSSTPTTTPPPTTPAPTSPGPASGNACGNDQSGPTPCPSGEYCQPWNPSFYQCRRLDAKCGQQETGVDYYGDDIATHQLLLPEQCCDKCFATAGCKAYTFVNYNADGKAYCYLKSGTGSRSIKVGVVSATIVL